MSAVALTMIFLLMVSLLGMNASYIVLKIGQGEEVAGYYPAARKMVLLFAAMNEQSVHIWHEIFWWSHIGSHSFSPTCSRTQSISMYSCRFPMYSFQGWNHLVN